MGTDRRLSEGARLGALAIALGACAGCGVKTTHLAPSDLPRERVALLCSTSATPVRVHTIDGKPGPTRLGYGSTWNGGHRVYVEPGRHELMVNYTVSRPLAGYVMFLEQAVPLVLDAQAGHVYKIRLEPGDGRYVHEVEDISERSGRCWR